MTATANDIRRKIASKEGWQTRRGVALAEAIAAGARARKPARKKELAAEAKKIRAAIRKGAVELADLRRQLSKVRKAEEVISIPPPPPVVPPPPTTPAVPASTFEDRVLEIGGGVGLLPDGRDHGLVWLDPVWDGSAEKGAWLDPLEDVIRHLERASGFPPFWRGRLRIQISWWEPMDDDIYGARYEGEDGVDGDYEGGDSQSPPANVAYFPPPPPEERQPRRKGERKTLTGWTRDPMKLLEILDTATERLRGESEDDEGWIVTGVIVEMVWGADGKLTREEITSL